jgi:hypothetical protein
MHTGNRAVYRPRQASKSAGELSGNSHLGSSHPHRRRRARNSNNRTGNRAPIGLRGCQARHRGPHHNRQDRLPRPVGYMSTNTHRSNNSHVPTHEDINPIDIIKHIGKYDKSHPYFDSLSLGGKLRFVKEGLGIFYEPFNDKGDDFIFIDLNNVEHLRQHSYTDVHLIPTVTENPNACMDVPIYFNMPQHGLATHFKWRDIFGSNCVWKVIRSYGPIAHYSRTHVDSKGKPVHGRYSPCGLKFKELGEYRKILNAKRPEHGELTKPDCIQVLYRIIKTYGTHWISYIEPWINYIIKTLIVTYNNISDVDLLELSLASHGPKGIITRVRKWYRKFKFTNFKTTRKMAYRPIHSSNQLGQLAVKKVPRLDRCEFINHALVPPKDKVDQELEALESSDSGNSFGPAPFSQSADGDTDINETDDEEKYPDDIKHKVSSLPSSTSGNIDITESDDEEKYPDESQHKVLPSQPKTPPQLRQGPTKPPLATVPAVYKAIKDAPVPFPDVKSDAKFEDIPAQPIPDLPPPNHGSNESHYKPEIVVKDGARIIKLEQLRNPKHIKLHAVLPTIKTKLCFPEKNANNLAAAVTSRQMKSSDSAASVDKTQCIQLIIDHISRIEFQECLIDPKFNDWLQSHQHWPAYKKAFYDLMFNGWPDNSSNRQGMLKGENVLTEREKAARLICMSNVRFQATYGPLIQKMTKTLKDHTKDDVVSIVCGLNRLEYGHYVEECIEEHNDDIEYCTGDFSKFDSTITSGLMEIERIVYKKICPSHSQEIDDFINRNQKDFKLFAADFSVNAIFNVPCSRASGDPNTTLGNSLINWAIWKYLVHKSEIKIHKILVCGDDVLIMAPRGNVAKLKAYLHKHACFAKIGMKLELSSTVTDYWQAEFLSSFFLAGDVRITEQTKSPKVKGHYSTTTRERIILVPKLGRIFSKIGVTHKTWNKAAGLTEIKKEKTTALKDVCWFLPAIMSNCSRYLKDNGRLSNRAKQRLLNEIFLKKGGHFTASNKTTYQLCLRYDVTINDINKFCQQVNPNFSYFLTGCFAEHMHLKDVSGGISFDDFDIVEDAELDDNIGLEPTSHIDSTRVLTRSEYDKLEALEQALDDL